MANLILKNVYGKNNGLVESPKLKNVEYKGNKAILSFDFADGLHFKNKESKLFEIAGTEGQFVPATAVIKGNQIILESKEVKNPVNVRYDWSNTAVPDLFNQSELPASSFSTEKMK
jgi:sialate O-acetylesterase